MFSSGFVNLGKSDKQRKLWPIFLKKKNLSVGKEKKKKFFCTSLPHYFKRYVKNCKGVRSTDFNLWF